MTNMFSVKQSAVRLFIVSCLALLLSAEVTIDTVIDLVFEQPDLAAALDAGSDQEEPDNATEHLLMPSQRGNLVSPPLMFTHFFDFQVSDTSLVTDLAMGARSSPHQDSSATSSPLPLLLPLRI